MVDRLAVRADQVDAAQIRPTLLCQTHDGLGEQLTEDEVHMADVVDARGLRREKVEDPAPHGSGIPERVVCEHSDSALRDVDNGRIDAVGRRA